MISVHSKMTASLLACGAALLLAVLTPATAPAAPTVVNCSPSKVKIVVSSPFIQTHTTSQILFVNIGEAGFGFTQGAAGGCVIVRFSAMTFAPGTTLVAVRAFLDDTTAALPGVIQYSANDVTGAGAHSFDFIFSSVTPGPHIIRMQFISGNGDSVTVAAHTTVVQYAP